VADPVGSEYRFLARLLLVFPQLPAKAHSSSYLTRGSGLPPESRGLRAERHAAMVMLTSVMFARGIAKLTAMAR
jgi:hypothetical protein